MHYFNAWQLHEDFLAKGRLHGWSHRMFAGYPVSYLYPIGTSLWINAVYALGLGLLTFSQAYAVAVWSFHMFTGLACYALGRVAGGPFVGLIAGWLALTDMSEFRLGGWAYTIDYGVWPQALSLNFALLALCALPAIAQRRTLAPLGAFGLWMGLAIITHPVQILFLAMLLGGFGLACAFATRVCWPVAMFRLLVSYALALLVAAVWFLPFWSARNEASVMGLWWDSTCEMGKELVELRAFPGTLGWVLALGVFGAGAMLRTRRFHLLFIAIMALLVPILCSSTFLDELHLPQLSSSFTSIQWVRMGTMAKPFWFVMCGYLAVMALARGHTFAGEDDAPVRSGAALARRASLAFLVSLLSLPVLVPAAHALWNTHVTKSLVTERNREYVKDRADMVAWLHRELPPKGYYRVGVFTGHNHDLLDLATELGKPFFKRGFTPATNFAYRVRDNNRPLLEAVNLRYGLSKIMLSPDDFDEIAHFGRYRVYEFKHWYPEPFQVIEGAGDVKVERFSDEEIVLNAAPGAKGRLRLNVSYFSRWRAYHNDERIPIGITTLPESPNDSGFMTVALAPGRYRFAFERQWPEHLGLPITLLGLFGCVAFIVVDRRRRGLTWLWRPMTRATERLQALGDPRHAKWQRTAIVVSVGGALLAAVGLAEWQPPLASAENGIAAGKVRYDFLERFADARANIEYPGSNEPCTRSGDWLTCRNRDGKLDPDRYVGPSPATITEYTMVRCIRARPEDDALLTVTYPQVPMASSIVGYYGIERDGRLLTKTRPVEFTVHVGGRKLYDEQTKTDDVMHWFTIPLKDVNAARQDVAFSVRADNVSKRHFCFYAQVVDP